MHTSNIQTQAIVLYRTSPLLIIMQVRALRLQIRAAFLSGLCLFQRQKTKGKPVAMVILVL